MNQRGITMIEIAIVIAIIGFAIGAILQGQSLSTSARAKAYISQQSEVRMAIQAFYDRYREIPGDVNRSGRIEADEADLVWGQLRGSGLMQWGNDEVPSNPYGARLDYRFDASFGKNDMPPRHRLHLGAMTPVKVLKETDTKIDDGLPYGGIFQFSTWDAVLPAECVDGAQWDVVQDAANCGAATI